jgi:glycosyltransferase involved in cell wall biosynthesis
MDTPYQEPLGGSESALCYLAEALAQQGHEIFFLCANMLPTVSRGVSCLPFSPDSIRQLGALDAFIVQNCVGGGRELRSLLPDSTSLVFWSQHAHDQPAVRALHDPAERQAYDHIVLVSDWQRQHYVRQFNLDVERTIILRNAIGPAFSTLFRATTSILAQKAKPPVLAYTSTPYRGLDLLLDAFGPIRQAVPESKLKVFSSMRGYPSADAEEQERFAPLYQRCRETDGVDYIGSLPQPELAQELRAVSVLAYPNTFAETSCIAVLEALASGCTVVTSDLAALPETTAGFATLIPIDGNREAYLGRFVEGVVHALQECNCSTAEDQLRRQVAHLIEKCTWSAMAREWLNWLNHIRARKA